MLRWEAVGCVWRMAGLEFCLQLGFGIRPRDTPRSAENHIYALLVFAVRTPGGCKEKAKSLLLAVGGIACVFFGASSGVGIGCYGGVWLWPDVWLRELAICIYRWKLPRLRCRGLRTSNSIQKRPPRDLWATN